MKTINVKAGDEVELLVQIYQNETFEYTGIVSSISDTELTLWTEDSPHFDTGVEREIDIPLNKIIEVEVFS
jgi:hypothetical protein